MKSLFGSILSLALIVRVSGSEKIGEALVPVANAAQSSLLSSDIHKTVSSQPASSTNVPKLNHEIILDWIGENRDRINGMDPEYFRELFEQLCEIFVLHWNTVPPRDIDDMVSDTNFNDSDVEEDTTLNDKKREILLEILSIVQKTAESFRSGRGAETDQTLHVLGDGQLYMTSRVLTTTPALEDDMSDA